jgi:muskelin
LYTGKPARFLKILPISSYKFVKNFLTQKKSETTLPSIFHVEIYGSEDIEEDTKIIKEESIKLCLKFLRENNFLSIFQDLQKKSGVLLEDEKLTKLHEKFVINGDFEATEKYVSEIQNIFKSYVEDSKYSFEWKQIISKEYNKYPSERSGSRY